LYWWDANLKDRTYLKRYTVMSVEGQKFNNDDEVKGRREGYDLDIEYG
jgi:hypothetical protein